jgi:soluble lytic murein transglycosylase
VYGWLGRQAALRLQPEAAALYQRALAEQRGAPLGWSDDTLAWGVRSALRHAAPAARWPMVLRLVGAMSPRAQQEPAWVYWKAQALRASAREGVAGDASRDEARRLLTALAGPLDFYALLAAEAIAQTPAWPAEPTPLSPAERQAAADHAGLQRAMLLLALDLRSEGWREWNYSLRGMTDRELMAAARLACDRSHWQLCINTAERTRVEIDVALRYPLPYADEIRAAAASTDLDLALVLGLIRQETRFMARLRSHAGATGLMQVMPATAQIVAKKLGMPCCTLAQLGDPQLNLRLGTQYLRWALDDVQHSEPLALAAYNAGPGRPRRWREAATMDAAAWAEGIPFNETRDYVKKVLGNAAVYQALLSGKPPSLRPRLGNTIGPREPTAPPPNTELP